MWIYILTVLLCVCIWKLGTKLLALILWYREICRCLSHFPLPVDHHWFYGIAHVVKDGNTYYEVIQKTVERWQPKAISFWLTWLRPGIVLFHPDLVKVVLKASHISCPKSATEYNFFKPWIGDGLPISGGAKWVRMRHLLTPAFHFDVLKPYVHTYNNVADLMLGQIKALSVDDKSIDAYSLVNRATLDNVLRCALSYVDESVQSTDNTCQHPYIATVTKVKEMLIKRSINPLIYYDTIYSLTSDSKDFKRCTKCLHDFSDNLIQQRRQSLEAEPSQLKKRHLDFLDILLTAKDETGTGLTDREIKDEVDTFTAAGHDTTASTISWTLYALAKYPEFQQQVRDEVNDILMDRHTLNHGDLLNLTFTTRFIKETLRMFCPIPSMSRQFAEPLTLDGVILPVGTEIEISQYNLHHNPAVWENHEIFDPDRFLPDNFAKMDPFSFIPFSAGQRNCIGQHLAMDVTKVFISRIVRMFTISLDINKPVERHIDLVTSVKNGMFLYFKES